MIPAMQEPGDCPCGDDICNVQGTKIAKVSGHLVFCGCISCRNRNNQKRGRRGQAKAHKALGGSGFTPYHEEAGLYYDLTTRPEVKTGYAAQSKKFREFVAGQFFLDALLQSEKSIPEGIVAKPSVSIDGKWLIVDIRS